MIKASKSLSASFFLSLSLSLGEVPFAFTSYFCPLPPPSCKSPVSDTDSICFSFFFALFSFLPYSPLPFSCDRCQSTKQISYSHTDHSFTTTSALLYSQCFRVEWLILPFPSSKLQSMVKPLQRVKGQAMGEREREKQPTPERKLVHYLPESVQQRVVLSSSSSIRSNLV